MGRLIKFSLSAVGALECLAMPYAFCNFGTDPFFDVAQDCASYNCGWFCTVEEFSVTYKICKSTSSHCCACHWYTYRCSGFGCGTGQVATQYAVPGGMCTDKQACLGEIVP
jgi:hypothetical protein